MSKFRVISGGKPEDDRTVSNNKLLSKLDLGQINRKLAVPDISTLDISYRYLIRRQDIPTLKSYLPVVFRVSHQDTRIHRDYYYTSKSESKSNHFIMFSSHLNLSERDVLITKSYLSKTQNIFNEVVMGLARSRPKTVHNFLQVLGYAGRIVLPMITDTYMTTDLIISITQVVNDDVYLEIKARRPKSIEEGLTAIESGEVVFNGQFGIATPNRLTKSLFEIQTNTDLER